MINKKICAICLTTDKPMLATAAWKDGELFIAEGEQLPSTRVLLEEMLISRVRDLESKDFEVLIDETSDFITSRVGVRVRLGDTGVSGRPILVDALDVFRELDRQKAITFPRGAAGRYRMPDTILDMERNAKGETTYRIDWAQLKSEQVLGMLCSYATSFNNVNSLNYLKAMYGAELVNPPPSALDPLKAIVKHVEHDSWLNGPRSSLTGKGNYL